MAHQHVGAETQPPLLELLNPLEISPDLLHDLSRGLVLEFLEYLFRALLVLNEAYHHMYPIRDRPRCTHGKPHSQGPKHITAMAGQGERMAFIGLLLRSADLIRYYKLQSANECDFAMRMEYLKHHRPEIAHGVAVLKFLMAGVCRNNISTLTNLLNLVQALSKSSKMCKSYHPPIQMHQFYWEGSNNCTLTLINTVLAQCPVCDSTKPVREVKGKLGLALDSSHWHGCGECESILVDIIVYTNMLSITNLRMMASLRLSLDYIIDLSQVEHQDREPNPSALERTVRRLFNFGFTEVAVPQQQTLDNLTFKLSMEYEVMFISGWQKVNKDDLNRLLLEGFLQQKERRPFFIQCKHQLLQLDPQSKCCEPQIRAFLEQVTHELSSMEALGLLQSVSPIVNCKFSIILEQDACGRCVELAHIPAIKRQLKSAKIPLQMVTVLPYIPDSVFLHRLTKDGGPVHLKNDLKPFEERHACMARGRCRVVKCHDHEPCHYSKPNKVLELDDKMLRPTYPTLLISTSQKKGDKAHRPRPTKTKRKSKKANH